MSVTLTEKAAGEVKRIIEEERLKQRMPEKVVLRMGVMGGGCSGFSYDLRFDDETNVNPVNDELTEAHGVTIAVDKRSSMYLNGTVVDFYEGIEERGFMFNNPHAQHTCGCGSSFQV